MRRVAIVLVLVLACSLALGACGGDESGDGSGDEVAKVAERIATAETPEQVGIACRDLLGPAFLEEAYGGDVSKCIARPVNHRDEGEDPVTLAVESVEVDGDEARATMRTSGGELGSSEGTWRFVRADGGWELERIEDDFVRSSFLTSVETVDGGALAFPAVRACMLNQIEGLDAGEMREIFFQSMRGDRRRFLNALLRLSGNCPDAMNRYVADRIATGVVAERGATPAQVACARRELVPLLEATGLTEQSMKASIGPDGGAESMVGAALAGLVTGAMKQCPAD